ncbi:GTPase ObgE [Salisediminibacterium halotolerans]|uniref:GTPase Obg n=1 Tax=Salisediminibacterium halotolerans TaxID=517425 RepID=A0A1H9TG63_9BACI|nr:MULTISPECIES: GTPase ObgE [Salisediminibacterium]RLJ78397.1 GTP-binding protein [Actinophytocola xinjiangensis]RPE85624.1 GTP-binding protein [Salisediminibacterium halotolerans]TWG37373.1 GTP-binding protein [Salisediminibacterium halotolerans]SER96017.1 GTP-binding protein [Salisediminibacterium haloalkalitolerans]GEL09232.1 GTPase Obg [Salisediminibacterium halotolerans]
MFVDKTQIYVKSGDGGNGMVAYRREKYVPAGGPAGGDGGRGADIVFVVDEGLRTLMDFRYKRHFKGDPGENGRTKKQHGKSRAAYEIQVPPGTTITDEETGQVLADLTVHGQRAVIARGGRGGRGNARFATPANPAPEIAENGEPGEEKKIVLELKLLADAGLIGFPSVGKSTLLSIVSRAKPKVADYHFTTIKPQLGVVETDDKRSFVLADLPGLIEGAHEGVGLGHQFLRHIERTRVLIHVIDMSGMEGRDPYDDYMTINKELEQYNLRLPERPQLVAANKMDLPGAEDNLELFREQVGENVQIFPISAATNAGIDDLIRTAMDTIEATPEFPLYEEEEEERVVYSYVEREKPYAIEKDDDGGFTITGHEIEKVFKMTDFNRHDSVQRFSRKMRKLGIDQELRDMGAEDGDTVRILDHEFEFVE